MNKKRYTLIITGAFLFATMLPLGHSLQESGYAESKIYFAIVFPGGPDPQGEGKNILNQFLGHLSKMTGISSSRLTGQYFNSLSTATSYIRQNRNCFVMASIGFYAANKRSLNLVPLTKVSMEGSDREQFFLLVKKGKYRNLNQLRGKVVSGNVLYENPRFLNKIVFKNKINVSTFFKMKPTQRPLTAVRRLRRGKVDGVLLNRMQYNSLKKLALFQQISVVYSSPSLPALGLMMVKTPVTSSVQEKVVRAMTGMCSLREGKKVCNNFGIQGFKRVNGGEVEGALKSY